MQFEYDAAFSRNIGWVTLAEQEFLRNCRVAVGGLGGVGGSHAIALARLGVGQFTLTDLDAFDWPNLNRQAGAFASTMGIPKVEVLARVLRDINPDVQLTLIPEGLDSNNIDRFLAGASIYMDGLDTFSLDIRRAVFARCRELGIPAVTAAPMGMGTAFLAFTARSMSFEDYFSFTAADSFEDRIIKFIVGVSPAMQQRHYLVDQGSVDIFKRKVPSTVVGIELAVGVACANALKLILSRGDTPVAPVGLHFDAYRNRLIRTWRPWGNRNPLQRIMFWYVRRLFKSFRHQQAALAGQVRSS